MQLSKESYTVKNEVAISRNKVHKYEGM